MSGVISSAGPEFLAAFTTVSMLKLRTAEGRQSLGRLLAREVSDPRSVERGIIQDLLDPIAGAVTDLLRETLHDRSAAEIHWVVSNDGRHHDIYNGRRRKDPEDKWGILRSGGRGCNHSARHPSDFGWAEEWADGEAT
jgi:Tetracyclin repressor-like, C-terminal domain